MSLQLPPDRRLDAPERMLETILSAPAETRDHDELAGRRRWGGRYLIAGIAAAAVLTVAAVGVGVVGHGQRTADPAPAAPPTASAPATVVAPPGKRVVVPVGTPVRFDHLLVTVHELAWTKGQGLTVRASVCVESLPSHAAGVDTVRAGWDPWTVSNTFFTDAPSVLDPANPPHGMFFSQNSVAVGQCASGWIPFGDEPGLAAMTGVGYHDELGDQARWTVVQNAHEPGSTVSFPDLTARTGDAIVSGGVYAIQVTTCVTAVPPDQRITGLRLRSDAWRLETDAGEVKTDDPITSAPPLPTTYPQETYVPVGRCVSGYIPFAVARGVRVTAIRFDQDLDDHASWLPSQ